MDYQATQEASAETQRIFSHTRWSDCPAIFGRTLPSSSPRLRRGHTLVILQNQTSFRSFIMFSTLLPFGRHPAEIGEDHTSFLPSHILLYP